MLFLISSLGISRSRRERQRQRVRETVRGSGRVYERWESISEMGDILVIVNELMR